MTIKLITPTTEHLEQLATYRDEFLISAHHIDGAPEFANATSVEQWLVDVENNRHWETVQEGWIPAEQYIAVDEQQTIVGMLNLRKALNDYLRNYIGHIGYSVAPSKRRQGLGTRILQLALSEAKKLGLQKVLVTCADDNIASAKVIEQNGGVLEDKRLDPGDGKLTRRYWITL